MACPFFYPTDKQEDSGYVINPRLPLGDPYRGECRASAESFAPHDARICNVGYARGACSRFPQDAPFDATRFHVIGESVQYVFEKACWPAGHGLAPHPDPVIQRQVEVFQESRRRRGQA